jgi:hypothetical protein
MVIPQNTLFLGDRSPQVLTVDNSANILADKQNTVRF